MKKINLNKKLTLNKETVSNLNDSEMNSIRGGADERTVLSATCGSASETWGSSCDCYTRTRGLNCVGPKTCNVD